MQQPQNTEEKPIFSPTVEAFLSETEQEVRILELRPLNIRPSSLQRPTLLPPSNLPPTRDSNFPSPSFTFSAYSASTPTSTSEESPSFASPSVSDALPTTLSASTASPIPSSTAPPNASSAAPPDGSSAALPNDSSTSASLTPPSPSISNRPATPIPTTPSSGVFDKTFTSSGIDVDDSLDFSDLDEILERSEDRFVSSVATVAPTVLKYSVDDVAANASPTYALASTKESAKNSTIFSAATFSASTVSASPSTRIASSEPSARLLASSFPSPVSYSYSTFDQIADPVYSTPYANVSPITATPPTPPPPLPPPSALIAPSVVNAPDSPPSRSRDPLLGVKSRLERQDFVAGSSAILSKAARKAEATVGKSVAAEKSRQGVEATQAFVRERIAKAKPKSERNEHYCNCLRGIMLMSIDDLKSPLFWRAAMAEFVGTMILTMVGCGSCIGYSPGTDLVRIALGFGLIVATVIWGIGHVSGGHVNPAVTLAMAATRKISAARAALYIIMQLCGAVIGAGILKGLTPEGLGSSLGATSLAKGVVTFPNNVSSDYAINPGQGFGIEFFITFVLVFVVFATCDNKRNDHGGSNALAIGLAVAVCHLWAVPATGASMNTARSFGPAVVAGVWDDHWIYWVGPLLGGVTAGFVYDHVFAQNSSKQKFRTCMLGAEYQGDDFDAVLEKPRKIVESEDDIVESKAEV